VEWNGRFRDERDTSERRQRLVGRSNMDPGSPDIYAKRGVEAE
jgi:hypothetical protein